MKKVNVAGYTVTRLIQKDPNVVKKWGKFWFKFKKDNGWEVGSAAASTLHSYIPKETMAEVEKTWPKDFKSPITPLPKNSKKKKPSWKVLENFLWNHYCVKHGAKDYDIAIRDCLTDLHYIANNPIRPKTDLSQRLIDAESVFEDEMR